MKLLWTLRSLVALLTAAGSLSHQKGEYRDGFHENLNFLFNMRKCAPVINPNSYDNLSSSAVHVALWFKQRPRLLSRCVNVKCHASELKTILVLLLILSGDIELKPGPVSGSSPDFTAPIVPVLVFPTKREREVSTNWERCMICQKVKKTETKGLYDANFDCLNHFKNAFLIGKRFNQESYASTIDRLTDCINSLTDFHREWHTKCCYAAFCNKVNITRLQNRNPVQLVTATDDTPPESYTLSRSKISPTDSQLCLFCQTRKPHLPSSSSVTSETDKVSRHVLAIANRNDEIRRRLIARSKVEGLKYHITCYNKEVKKTNLKYTAGGGDAESDAVQEINRKAFVQLTDILDVGFAETHVYILDAVNKCYRNLIGDLNRIVGRSSFPAFV